MIFIFKSFILTCRACLIARILVVKDRIY